MLNLVVHVVTTGLYKGLHCVKICERVPSLVQRRQKRRALRADVRASKPAVCTNSQCLSVLHAFRTEVVEENQIPTLCLSHADGRPNISEGNVSLVTERTRTIGI